MLSNKVYHGTYNEVGLDKDRSDLIWFTDSKKVADQYRKRSVFSNEVNWDKVMGDEDSEQITESESAIDVISDEQGIDLAKGKIYEGNLKLSNPLDLTGYSVNIDDIEELWNDLNEKGLLDEPWTAIDEEFQYEIRDNFEGKAIWKLLEEEGVYQKARQQGYDAIIINDVGVDGKPHVSYGLFGIGNFEKLEMGGALKNTSVFESFKKDMSMQMYDEIPFMISDGGVDAHITTDNEAEPDLIYIARIDAYDEGKGHGTQFIEKLKSFALENGYGGLFAYPETERSLNFFLKQGFVKEEETDKDMVFLRFGAPAVKELVEDYLDGSNKEIGDNQVLLTRLKLIEKKAKQEPENATWLIRKKIIQRMIDSQLADVDKVAKVNLTSEEVALRARAQREAESEPRLTMFSFGGGQDSFAMLYKFIYDPEFRKRYAPNDLIIAMSDTGNEFPLTYKAVKDAEKLCKEHNIHFQFITPDMGYHTAGWQSLKANLRRNRIILGAAMGNKSCTISLKVNVVDKYMHTQMCKLYGFGEKNAKSGWVHYREKFGVKARVIIGFAKEEEIRVIKSGKMHESLPKWKRENIQYVYPMIEEGWDRAAAQKIILEYRDLMPPSNCMICFYQSDQELLWLERNYPAEFADWVELEKAKLNRYEGQVPKNYGVYGAITLEEKLKRAKVKYGHMTDEELWQYKLSHGHCVKSAY